METQYVNTQVQQALPAPTSRLDTLARLILRVTVFLLPLAVFPTTWFSLPSGKMALLAFGVLVSLLLWAIARLREHRVEFPKTNLLWTALLLVLGYIVAAVLSGSLIQSFIGFGFERDTVLAMVTFVSALFVVSVTTQKVMHFVRLQQAALAAFLLLGVFQIVRILVGADVILPTLFSSDPTATMLGSWNDLAVFSGLAVIMALSGLSLFSSKMVRGTLYVTTLIGLFLLIAVNLSVVWITLVVAMVLLMTYIVTDASYSKDDESFKMQLPWKRLAPSIVVILVSLVFLFGGTGLGQGVSNALGVSYVDVRPSWQGTLSVGTAVLKENILFGVGPNAFQRAWIDHKPLAVNETNFWSTDFNFGIGFIPTAFITGGIVVGVLWLLFFASFLYMGVRTLARRTAAPAHMYMVISSYLGAAYLWILSIFYVPQIAMLGFTFILTGVVIAAAHISGVLRTQRTAAGDGYSTGAALTGALILTVIISCGALLINGERMAANIMIAHTVSVANAGDFDRAEKLAARISFFSGDIRSEQIKTNIGIARLSAILNDTEGDQDALRAQFETELAKTITAAQSVVQKDESNYQNWLLLGDVYASLAPLEVKGAYDSAVVAYKEAGVRNPNSPAVAMRLARLAVAEKDLEGAREYIKAALALKSNYTDAYYLQSQIAIQENDVEDAIASTEATVVLNPQNTGLLFQLGVLQYSAGAYDKTVTILERAVTLNPNYANALYFLGLAYEKVGNAEGTLAAFERVAALNPENTDIKTVVDTLKNGGTAASILEQPAATDAGAESTQLPVSEEL